MIKRTTTRFVMRIVFGYEDDSDAALVDLMNFTPDNIELVRATLMHSQTRIVVVYMMDTAMPDGSEQIVAHARDVRAFDDAVCAVEARNARSHA